MDHLALINPSRAINNEDRCVDWLTYRNIIEWNKRAKEFLVEIKMGKDERGLIRTCLCLFTSIPTITKLAFLFCFISDEIESEMSLIHEDDVDWFLTMDETHHLFSTVGAKGGATAGRYTNPSFPRSGERCIESSFHTTGVYGTTLRGEPLPPMYILSTNSLNEDDYKIDPRVNAGLPIVVASYGKVMAAHWSAISVRRKGLMDTEVCGINF